MSKTIVVEFPWEVAGTLLRVIKQAKEEVNCPVEGDTTAGNYGKGLSYAYLDCAEAMIQEALDED